MSEAKVVRDGKVAVLVSPGYGAGWSTWADNDDEAVFAPDVVGGVEAGKPGHPDQFKRYGYTGGLRDVQIAWVPLGTRFIIEEYDGAGRLVILDPNYGHVA